MDNLGYKKDSDDSITSDKITTPKSIEKTENHTKFIYLRQIFCAIVISLSKYVIYFLVSSTAMLPDVLNGPTIEKPYNSEDLKWLASIPNLFGTVFIFITLYITNFVGPAKLLRIGLGLGFLLYLPPVAWPTLPSLWVSRMIHFSVVGIFDVIYIPLIAELCEPRIRGFCLALSEVAGNFCILYAFIAFSFLGSVWAIVCCSIPVFLGFLGSFFVPESPYWLVSRGRKIEAGNSFFRILGPSRKGRKEELLEETIICYQNNTKNPSLLNQILLLSKSRNWKPLLLTMLLFVFREFGGHSVVFYYSLNIFREVSSSIDEFTCTIIIGSIAVGGTVLSSYLQIYFGRRVLLISTLLVSTLCLFLAGIFLHFDLAFKVVPLICIMVESLMTGIGIGPGAFVLLGELTPAEVSFLNTGIAYSLLNFCVFVVLNVTPTLLRIFEIGPVLLAFSLVNVAAVMVIFFTLPETKGKSLTELQHLFT